MIRKWVVIFIMGAIFTGGVFSHAGQENDIILQLKNKIIDIQNEGKLGFRSFIACSNIITYGSYVPLPKPEVKTGSRFFIYYEPENVFTNRVQENYEVWYTQDMIVLDADGQVLLNKEGALNFRHSGRAPIFDLYATNTLNVGKLPPGIYVFRAVLHDKLKKTTAQKDLSFKIVK